MAINAVWIFIDSCCGGDDSSRVTLLLLLLKQFGMKFWVIIFGPHLDSLGSRFDVKKAQQHL